MPKPPLTELVKRTFRNAWVVDVKRGTQDGFSLHLIEETPASLRPGRYIVVSMDESLLAQRRLEAIEASMQLSKLMRKRSGRHSL